MSENYDSIVLGVGGFGSGALYHLARRGSRVLGIEQFGIAHDRGSSHGQTRIIRKAYFEHPDYVPLLHRAYELWLDLEQDCGRQLLHQVGLFISGEPDCESVSGTLLAARQHNLPVEVLDSGAARRRFPGYHFPESFTTVFEPAAGYLEVEACVAAHVAAACRHGATLRTGEAVLGWKSDGRRVTVRTTHGTYSAATLVITAGPWAAPLLDHHGGSQSGEWGNRLRVARKPVFWFAAGDEFDVSRGNSTFFFETKTGQFYGFPRIDGQTIKMAQHTGGDDVDDPTHLDREQHPRDLAPIQDFLRTHFPGVQPQPVQFSVCMYTRTPDSHFCVDRHHTWNNVIIGAGFSGHGFKFTSVLGEALADLALKGRTELPIQFLSTRRFR